MNKSATYIMASLFEEKLITQIDLKLAVAVCSFIKSAIVVNSSGIILTGPLPKLTMQCPPNYDKRPYFHTFFSEIAEKILEADVNKLLPTVAVITFPKPTGSFAAFQAWIHKTIVKNSDALQTLSLPLTQLTQTAWRLAKAATRKRTQNTKRKILGN